MMSLCIIRAIIVCLATNHQNHLEKFIKQKLSNNQIKYIKIGRKLQTDLAKQLQISCRVPVRNEGNNLEDLKIFENKLEIRVVVLESNEKDGLVYSGNAYF